MSKRKMQVDEKIAISKFECELKRKFEQLYKPENYTELVFLCVGTDKIIGDAIGPIVGTKLEEVFIRNRKIENISIYGKIGNTLNFKNATNIIEGIYLKYEAPFIVTIDAALSEKEVLERIVINEGKIRLGNSLGRSIKLDSNINIKGVVGIYKENFEENIKTLKNAEINSIMKLSQNISDGIQKVLVHI